MVLITSFDQRDEKIIIKKEIRTEDASDRKLEGKERSKEISKRPVLSCISKNSP